MPDIFFVGSIPGHVTSTHSTVPPPPTSTSSVTRWLYYLFNIWPFTIMNVCPTNGQSRFKIFPNMKETLQNLLNILKWSPKLRNFAKFGHTVDVLVAISSVCFIKENKSQKANLCDFPLLMEPNLQQAYEGWNGLTQLLTAGLGDHCGSGGGDLSQSKSRTYNMASIY